MTAMPCYCTMTVGGRPAARIEKPAAAGAIICRASSPILCTGRHLADPSKPEREVLGHLSRFALAHAIPVITVPQCLRSLSAAGISDCKVLSLMEAGQRLVDPGWTTAPGRAPPDLALFAGVPRMTADLLFSGLRAGAAHRLRTISLDRFYQPYATLSFPDLSPGDWVKSITAVTGRADTK